jgi:putative transposase
LGGCARPFFCFLFAFLQKQKHNGGVDKLVAGLRAPPTPVAPSTYYDARGRLPSARAVHDEQLKIEIMRVYQENYEVYGARKTWLQLNREDIAVARCTVERLMKSLGLQGILRGKKIRTTIPDDQAQRATDRVKRNFNPLAPNKLWVADFTYVPTLSGTVYVAFIIDAYARRILGWKAATSMKTDLVLDTLEMAIFTRVREGINDLSGLIHHNDAGSQYTSIAFTTRLINAGVDPSVGSVGDCYDNALAESINGLYKTELIKHKETGA